NAGPFACDCCVPERVHINPTRKRGSSTHALASATQSTPNPHALLEGRRHNPSGTSACLAYASGCHSCRLASALERFGSEHFLPQAQPAGKLERRRVVPHSFRAFPRRSTPCPER